mmetsp:Transcript_54589/g.116657  ORF Transcript_54589/g.116657 Transcript_54589/m.116657 type:complete len:223 (-) Transcript_54589:109-777(-)
MAKMPPVSVGNTLRLGRFPRRRRGPNRLSRREYLGRHLHLTTPSNPALFEWNSRLVVESLTVLVGRCLRHQRRTLQDRGRGRTCKSQHPDNCRISGKSGRSRPWRLRKSPGLSALSPLDWRSACHRHSRSNAVLGSSVVCPPRRQKRVSHLGTSPVPRRCGRSSPSYWARTPLGGVGKGWNFGRTPSPRRRSFGHLSSQEYSDTDHHPTSPRGAIFHLIRLC